MELVQQVFHTDEWYDKLKKPSITPPKWAFPVVWTILYIMIAASLYLYLKKTGLVYSTGLLFYIIQVVLNLCWTPIFFWAKMTTFALIECFAMWVCILINIIQFEKVS
jgi:benzodiazapine receptor